jgi:ryanodine receptor 2
MSQPLPTYRPAPLATSQVDLPPDVLALTEQLARHAHEVWARQRLLDGWTWGPSRDDLRKQHPCLIPYEELPESERQYDRNAALETVRAILALGYRIQPPPR